MTIGQPAEQNAAAPGMPPPATPTERPMRADARRNRARLLQVAYEAFAAEGLAVPVDEIARRAGVGAGTVYRHFPTKESLFRAIVTDRVDRLVERASSMAARADPGEALLGYLRWLIDAGSTDMVLADALAGAGFDIAAAAPEAERSFQEAVGALLSAAQRAGAVRPDVNVADVKALMVGCQAMQRYRGDPDASRRLVALALDGLRPT